MPNADPAIPTSRLEVICGCMFAGKSTELIRRLEAAGPGAVGLRPRADTRSARDAITTHAGRSWHAVTVSDAAGVAPAAGSAIIVGIDEAHFFGAALVAPVLTMLARGARVIVAGLERDHRGHPFDPMPALLVEADEVTKLSAPCAVCGRPAIHSQRMIDTPDRIVVGGAGDYQPRCRSCFVPGR